MSSVNSCKTYIYTWLCYLLSETHLKLHYRFFNPNYHFHRTDRFPGIKSETAVTVRKGILHNSVDLPPPVSVETTGVYIPIGNGEVLLTPVTRPHLHDTSQDS
jgi:hypothetical protein